MKKIILMFVALVFVAAGCSSSTSFETVSADKAKDLVENGKVDVILDVRTPEEYSEGNIEGSILLPLQELEAQLDSLDKDQTYLVYCRSGNRSLQASTILSENGFKHIYNLDGGFPEWVAKN